MAIATHLGGRAGSMPALVFIGSDLRARGVSQILFKALILITWIQDVYDKDLTVRRTLFVYNYSFN